MNAYTFVLAINFFYFHFVKVVILFGRFLADSFTSETTNSSTKRRALCKARFGLEAMLLLLTRRFVVGGTWTRVLLNVQFNRGRV